MQRYSTINQKTLRRWYKKGNYTEYKCSICGLLPVWQNKELTLILDHINGLNNDDRLENLRWVCPNCNMQLPTTNGKNIIQETSNITFGLFSSSKHCLRVYSFSCPVP